MIALDKSQTIQIIMILPERTLERFFEKPERKPERKKERSNPSQETLSFDTPDSERNAERNLGGTRTDTKQKESSKNVCKKELTESAYAFEDLDFKKTWDEWTEYRRQLKRPLTPLSIKRQNLFLLKFPREIAIKMITQSIEQGWQGIHELKTNSNGTHQQPSYKRKQAGLNHLLDSIQQHSGTE